MNTNFGKPQTNLQQYDCSSQDFGCLFFKLLADGDNPFTNWKKQSKKKIPSPRKIKSSDVTSWFPKDSQHAVFYDGKETTTPTKPPLTYKDLHKCVTTCPPYNNNTTTSSGMTVVAVLLPSTMMAEMAVVLVSLLSKSNVCVAPLDPNMPPMKLCEAFQQLNCQGIVTSRNLCQGVMDILGCSSSGQKIRDVRIVESRRDKVGAVNWTIFYQKEVEEKEDDKESYEEISLTTDNVEHPVLLLRTSGTTSVPKVVPITASSLLYNATCIAASLRLKRDDVGCNAMPLFHIGGLSCALFAVLVSGSSAIMRSFDPELFLDTITTTESLPTSGREVETLSPAHPTWYYGVPSMHKTLTLTAKARLQDSDQQSIPNKLRFIRSGAAHLPHKMAVELSKVFNTAVIPTYSMSECMPVCSSHKSPVIWSNDIGRDYGVGQPIGCSLRIVNELGNVLPYGNVGEVALMGPGVLTEYAGNTEGAKSRTPDGHWFRTGDIGELDRNGNLKLQGRLKEMIKRGGDQVWPNEVDLVIGQVPGVSEAVTFGVPNELWGEEVAVAVVLEDSIESKLDHDVLRQSIIDTCKEKLESSAVPCQIVVLPSRDRLLKGPTGKYLRGKLAEHLEVKPVDTGALKVLEGMVSEENVHKEHKEATPSLALNGVRLITACFVVQGHLGLYPNNAWLKISSFSLNMTIFFMLGGFQLAIATKNPVSRNWAEWVGTKIGTMHALFVVTQIIALPAYLLFQCGPHGYQETFEDEACNLKAWMPQFVFNTITGMVPREDSANPPSWFQTAFYMFFMIFPPLDAHLRKIPSKGLLWRLVLNLAIASIFFVFVHFWLLEYLVIGYLPALVSAMIAGYFFSRYAVVDETVVKKNAKTGFFQNPRVWGVIADIVSLIFIGFEVLTALSSGCSYMEEEDFMEMRPGVPIPEEGYSYDNKDYVYACDLTYDEFTEYVHDPSMPMITRTVEIIGWGRAGTPLVLLWIYALAHGQGLTARFFHLKPIQWLSPLAYPLYLLHIPLARYYWIATRGLEAEPWWETGISAPVEWFEVWLILALCLVLGFVLDRTVVAFLTRYTVTLGVKVCQWVSKCCFCCCRNKNAMVQDDANDSTEWSNLQHVEAMVKRITGNQNVSRSTHLRDLGLDSLGATALLGTLRVSVPIARKITLQQLVSFETVGDLVDALDAIVVLEKRETTHSNEDDSDV